MSLEISSSDGSFAYRSRYQALRLAQAQTDAPSSTIEEFSVKVETADGTLSYHFRPHSEGGLKLVVERLGDREHRPVWYNINGIRYKEVPASGDTINLTKADHSIDYQSSVRAMITRLETQVLPSASGNNKGKVNAVIKYLKGIVE